MAHLVLNYKTLQAEDRYFKSHGISIWKQETIHIQNYLILDQRQSEAFLYMESENPVELMHFTVKRIFKRFKNF